MGNILWYFDLCGNLPDISNCSNDKNNCSKDTWTTKTAYIDKDIANLFYSTSTFKASTINQMKKLA